MQVMLPCDDQYLRSAATQRPTYNVSKYDRLSYVVEKELVSLLEKYGFNKLKDIGKFLTIQELRDKSTVYHKDTIGVICLVLKQLTLTEMVIFITGALSLSADLTITMPQKWR